MDGLIDELIDVWIVLLYNWLTCTANRSLRTPCSFQWVEVRPRGVEEYGPIVSLNIDSCVTIPTFLFFSSRAAGPIHLPSTSARPFQTPTVTLQTNEGNADRLPTTPTTYCFMINSLPATLPKAASRASRTWTLRTATLTTQVAGPCTTQPVPRVFIPPACLLHPRAMQLS